MKKKILCALMLILALAIFLISCEHVCEYGEWSVTKEPTCEENGVQERVCPEGHKETQSIPARHAYENGICKNCGKKAPSEGLWIEIFDYYSTVTNGNLCDEKDVVIPETYEGVKVTQIDEYCFSYSDITSITIPDSIERINESAFSDCQNLKSVYIYDLEKWANIYFEDDRSNPLFNGADLYLNGELVTELSLSNESYLSNFKGCTSIKSVVFEEGVEGLNSFAFENCTNLEEITIPKSLSYISDSAFSGCNKINKIHISDLKSWCENSNPADLFESGAGLYLNGELLTDIIIPDGTTKISYNTFYGYTKLKSVIIPESITEIGYSAFANCIGLEEIIIPGSVTNLVQAFEGCDNLKKATIKEGVTEIGEKCFEGLKHLETVILPDSIKTIGKYAFHECVRLENVYLGNGLERIESYAFHACNSLEKIYFNGLEKDFDLILNYGYNGLVIFNTKQPQ